MMGAGDARETTKRRDLDFQLFEVLDVEKLVKRPCFADHDKSTFTATLDLAEALAAERFQSHYRKSDLSEPVVENGMVRVIPEIEEALSAFSEAGFLTAHLSYDEGGQQLPWTIVQSCYAFFQAGCIGTSAYYFLTVAAANVISKYGTEQQKRLFAKPLQNGRFYGTMCLSEPQAGSSLAEIRTRATPISDEAYRISGSKMWISGGEHEMGENIVHLLLAKIDGAPAGTRGISLFIVPKRRVLEDGSVGERNGITLVGLNHKMGYRAATNTMLNFGEQHECVGFLVGEPNRGLEYMFVMMNEARISVGAGATMLGYAGYRASLAYAKERIQGRHPDRKDPAEPPVPIIEHADIRRLLLTQKSYVEGAMALFLYAAKLVDDERSAETAEQRTQAEILLAMLTPIVKSWPSEYCLEANKLAIQVLGGYGYTIDFPVEQYYRDNRLNMIHEGTNGIQALDLLARKITMHNGAGLAVLFHAIRCDIELAGSDAELSVYADALETALLEIEDVTQAMLPAARNGRLRLYLANASIYQDMLGHVVVAWMWLRQAHAAQAGLAMSPADDDNDFYRGKLAACRFFFGHELGRIAHWAPILRRLDATTLETQPAWL